MGIEVHPREAPDSMPALVAVAEHSPPGATTECRRSVGTPLASELLMGVAQIVPFKTTAPTGSRTRAMAGDCRSQRDGAEARQAPLPCTADEQPEDRLGVRPMEPVELKGASVSSGGSCPCPPAEGWPVAGSVHSHRRSSMVAHARRQLRSGNPSGAFRALVQARERFPRGVLVQEREALTIEALARSGQSSEARARCSDFLTHWLGLQRRRIREFTTTLTLEAAMAAPAMTGLKQPSAASGRPITL